jgi:glucose-6-phosphate 1-dehydrogenase
MESERFFARRRGDAEGHIGNAIFEPVWNRRYIDHVQLIVAESIGVEGRGAFYEQRAHFVT